MGKGVKTTAWKVFRTVVMIYLCLILMVIVRG
jgi:hypothetical protein